MDSLSSKCIEEANSTDCLLRAIINFLQDAQKKNEAEFEWDPITFGFTVSIALIAAGFALITIVQAVLAAGPGRRKSNSEAIGKWAKYTKRKWQFWDVGYLHISKTPILTIENVLAYLESKNDNADNTEKALIPLPEVGSSHRSKGLAASAAKWLVFLDEIGLSHLELPDEALETWLADYLPGDLLAVPALIEVKFVYIFMSLFCKPFRILGIDVKYPVLMDNDFQFEVRQHPTLGSIATFSKYHQGSQRTWRGRITPERLSLVDEQARGLVPVTTTPTRMDGDSAKKVGMQRGVLIDHLDTAVGDHIDFSYQTDTPWFALRGHWCFCTFEETAHKHGQWRNRAHAPFSPSSTTLFALMFADIPKAIPEIFPRGKLDFEGIFEALSISANIFSGDKLEPDNAMAENDHLLGLVFSSSRYRYGDCPLRHSLRRPHGRSACRCQQIVRECKAIFQSCDTTGGGTLGIAADELFQFRNDAIGMLVVVESWLRHQSSPQEVRCTKFNLSSETIQLQHIAKFLGSNKRSSLGLSLFDFLQWYRDYIESETDEVFMWKIRSEVEDDPEEFRQLLRALAKSSGVDETLIEDLKKDPSLGGLIPTNAVWPKEPCNKREVSLDLRLFKFA
ncbi:uncharacterized protein B0J16DRAFT_417936, partial [Fusarium flagelliforme]|uniref:uncharacterized protein n=1 Tax=Fusarium flagelliforme TaxID=2675880 RepID=UPI001E8D54EF